jgi:hypothetical protein
VDLCDDVGNISVKETAVFFNFQHILGLKNACGPGSYVVQWIAYQLFHTGPESPILMVGAPTSYSCPHSDWRIRYAEVTNIIPGFLSFKKKI